MNRRVVITGCGVVSPLGNSRESLWDSLRCGRSGVREIRSVQTASLPSNAGGEVVEFRGHIDDFGPLDATVKKNIRKGLKVMCREIQMGVAAAQLALHDSALNLDAVDRDRIGVLYGSDYIMSMPDEFAAGVRKCVSADGRFEFARWAELGMPQVTPLWLLKYLPNMPACHVAIYNDLRGPNNSLTVREASANLAIAESFSTITRGAAEMMVVGATGSRIHPLRSTHTVLQEEVASGGADPASLARPFDEGRRGMVMGEGAAALVLEELEFAQRRGARIVGEVVGYGSSAVMGRDGVADRAAALRNVMQQALQSARLSASDVGHIHAHGLGTQRGDVAEANAIQQVFGAPEGSVPVVAAKSYFGNLGAAGGMVELLCSLLALEHGSLFRTLNYERPDPECPVRVVTREDIAAGDSVLNVNVTPQAQASAVIVRKFHTAA